MLGMIGTCIVYSIHHNIGFGKKMMQPTWLMTT